ncbi:hypothetical protein [Saccharibacillus sp. JS10]|uniref:hypothetical protein n=1 Tax=Saccharibacillus sp. JS10 TaxID=2950552 RepID=UPI00210C447D|nr:hypothetical protein [Saccharibacillus sp. JS10]MCQ4087477.1 hypothetical protein [Saccharibacillus sp. JS10]
MKFKINFKPIMASLTLLIFLGIILAACTQANPSESSYAAVIRYENEQYIGQEAVKFDRKSLSKVGEISERVNADTSPTANLSSNALDKGTEVFQDAEGNLWVAYSGGEYQIFKKDTK